MQCPAVVEGARCPHSLEVVDSRDTTRGAKRRRRRCAAGHRSTWYEFQVDDVASADFVVQAVLDVLRPRIFELLGDLSLTTGGGRRILDPRGARFVALLQRARDWVRGSAASHIPEYHALLRDIDAELEAILPSEVAPEEGKAADP